MSDGSGTMIYVDFVIPDVPDPIVAWRCFNLAGYGTAIQRGTLDLWSLNRSAVWPVDGSYITATCNLSKNPCAKVPSPVEDAERHVGKGCGIYAFKNSLSIAEEYRLPYVSSHHCRVWGQVQLWGDVFDYDLGYRAQYARVRNLVAVEDVGLDAQTLAALTGLPCYTIPRPPGDFPAGLHDMTICALTDTICSMDRAGKAFAHVYGTALPQFAAAASAAITPPAKKRWWQRKKR